VENLPQGSTGKPKTVVENLPQVNGKT